MDVAQFIKPETVSLRSITHPAHLRILEQNYEFNLISPNKLLDKYVGKQVRLVNVDRKTAFSEREATLLSNHQGPTFEMDGQVDVGHPGQIVLPELPKDLISKPSLVWLLDNDGTDHEVEVTYLTKGMRWRADYVIKLAVDDSHIDLEGWVTLDNNSGAQFTDAQLKVVGGDVNVVTAASGAGGIQDLYSRDMLQVVDVVCTMTEEAFADYHLYSLPRRTTLKQKESKQVSLLASTGIDVQKVYEYRGHGEFYSVLMPSQEEESIDVFLKFDNKKENQLGMPLPAGIMRVYKQDGDGSLQFAGEDEIEHTAKDEEVRLKLGKAFDVIGERIQTDFRSLSDSVTETAFEIKLRNHKAEDVEVDIVEAIPGQWEILESSIPHQKKDACTAIFPVSVPKDGEVRVTYRVLVKW